MSAHITLRQLEIFLAVARAGHVTRASASLHLSQSAASMALAQLERQLETVLFERTARSLRLTARGRLLAAEAQDLLTRVQSLPTLLCGEGGTLRGELRIAASQTIGRYLLATALTKFAHKYRAASARCQIRNTEQAVAALLDHEADVGYVEGPVMRPELKVAPWRRDCLQIVTAHGSTAPRRLTPARLAGLPWIMREPGSGTRELFDHAVRNAGLPPLMPLQTMDDSEAIKQAVLAGAGFACLPQLAVAAEVHQRRLAVVSAPFLSLERQLWRVMRQAAFEGPLLRAFEGILSH